jgi:hypothetical protein
MSVFTKNSSERQQILRRPKILFVLENVEAVASPLFQQLVSDIVSLRQLFPMFLILGVSTFSSVLDTLLPSHIRLELEMQEFFTQSPKQYLDLFVERLMLCPNIPLLAFGPDVCSFLIDRFLCQDFCLVDLSSALKLFLLEYFAMGLPTAPEFLTASGFFVDNQHSSESSVPLQEGNTDSDLASMCAHSVDARVSGKIVKRQRQCRVGSPLSNSTNSDIQCQGYAGKECTCPRMPRTAASEADIDMLPQRSYYLVALFMIRFLSTAGLYASLGTTIRSIHVRVVSLSWEDLCARLRELFSSSQVFDRQQSIAATSSLHVSLRGVEQLQPWTREWLDKLADFEHRLEIVQVETAIKSVTAANAVAKNSLGGRQIQDQSRASANGAVIPRSRRIADLKASLEEGLRVRKRSIQQPFEALRTRLFDEIEKYITEQFAQWRQLFCEENNYSFNLRSRYCTTKKRLLPSCKHDIGNGLALGYSSLRQDYSASYQNNNSTNKDQEFSDMMGMPAVFNAFQQLRQTRRLLLGSWFAASATKLSSGEVQRVQKRQRRHGGESNQHDDDTRVRVAQFVWHVSELEFLGYVRELFRPGPFVNRLDVV